MSHSLAEMEKRLLHLAKRWTARQDGKNVDGIKPHVDTNARDEYRRLHPKWVAAKNQTTLDI